jgi:hypothetical protein
MATRLATEDRAPVLVVSQGWKGYGGPCPPKTRGVELICFDPKPGNTRGEAEVAGQLAKHYGWHSVVLVTTPAQDTRARILMRRYFGGSIYVIIASLPWDDWPYQIVYGWGALFKALFLQRACLCEQSGRSSQWRCVLVPLRPDGDGKRPRDRQFGIVECDRDVLGRVVGAVDLIGHVGGVGESLKPVRAAVGYVERDLLVVTEFEALPVPVCRRSRPKVHHDVEDCTI